MWGLNLPIVDSKCSHKEILFVKFVGQLGSQFVMAYVNFDVFEGEVSKALWWEGGVDGQPHDEGVWT